jgi:hypothetical protein
MHTQRLSRYGLLVFGVSLLSCSSADDKTQAAAPAAVRPLAHVVAESSCGLASPIQISDDSVGPLPLRITAAELQNRCHDALPADTVGFDGPNAALRLVVGIDTVWAIQEENEYSIHPREAISLWRSTPHALKLQGGPAIPRTIAALRAWDPSAILVADKRDDSDGVYVVRCRNPRIIYVFGYDSPTPADTGAWALSARPTADTVTLERVEIETRSRRAKRAGCVGANLTFVAPAGADSILIVARSLSRPVDGFPILNLPLAGELER